MTEEKKPAERQKRRTATEAASRVGSMVKAMFSDVIQAKEEGNDAATTTFDQANQVEKIHYGLYSKTIEGLEKGQEPPDTKMHVCRGCGNTVEGEPPETCPICGAPKSWFMHIE